MEIRWTSPLALARRSLRTKIIAWFFVPTAIILVAVALVNFYAYQKVTEDLVFERDRDLIRLGAAQFATGLAEYTDLLDSVARDAAVAAEDRAALHQVLETAAVPLAVFDGGLLVIDTFGTVMAAEPELPGLVGQDWSDRRFFRRMVRSVSLKPAFSDITTVEPLETEVIIVAAPITGAQGQFFGSVAGMFRLGRTATNAFYGGIVKLRIGGSGKTYLVDRTGRVIYHSDPDHIGADFSGQPVVQQALAGQSGAVRTDDFDGRDIVAGFAEVPSVEWGLITEESWADVKAGSRSSQRALILLLALGVVIPALLVAFGLSPNPPKDVLGDSP